MEIRTSRKVLFWALHYTSDEIKEFLKNRDINYKELPYDEIPHIVADLIAQEKVVGWFQGRIEFGPRALGSRSIIGDARSPKMQSVMNLKIKFRESFRPFAPSVLNEYVSDYFEVHRSSPYMLLYAYVKPEKRRRMTEAELQLWGIDKLNVVRSEIPAITHVDYSDRLQTVYEATNPLYHKMTCAFYELTGCPVSNCEHLVQCPRRANCLLPFGCIYVLHANRDGLPGDEKSYPGQKGAKALRDGYRLEK